MVVVQAHFIVGKCYSCLYFSTVSHSDGDCDVVDAKTTTMKEMGKECYAMTLKGTMNGTKLR